MDLEIIEVLALAGEVGDGSSHWSQNQPQPRYSLRREDVRTLSHTQRFTCFDVAEKVGSDHDIVFAGKVSPPSRREP